MSRIRAWLFPPLLALSACSAASSGTNAGGNNGQGSSGGATSDDTDGSQGNADASQAIEAGPTSPGSDATADAGGPGTGPAGVAGANAFAAQICAHEEQCALIDASASTCTTDFEAYYETSGASPWAGASSPPPLELYRADYVTALGTCIAASSCSQSAQASDTDCSAALLTPNDAGMAAIEPTGDVTTLCKAFAASSCLASQSGAGDCATTVALFNDQALQTATACLSGTDCSTVSACFAAALTQQ